METNNKKLRQKFFPTELEHAIDVILLKYENDNPKEIELIDSMFEQLRVQKEFKKMVEYNHADEDKEGFWIKKIFKNEKYEQELAQLEFSVHLNNGTYDRVLKKLREYLEVVNNKSRIKETLENVTEFEKLESNSNLKKVI